MENILLLGSWVIPEKCELQVRPHSGRGGIWIWVSHMPKAVLVIETSIQLEQSDCPVLYHLKNGKEVHWFSLLLACSLWQRVELDI